MKFKLGELGIVTEILAATIFDRNRAEGTPARRLPSKASYWLSRFLTRLQEEHQKEYPVFEKSRIALCEAHSKKDEKGQPVILKGKGCKQCGAEYKEDAEVKDEATGKMVPQTVCTVCGAPLAPTSKYDIIDYPAFNKELAELSELAEIELPWKPIPLAMLGDTEFAGEEMLILVRFLEEPEGMRAEKYEAWDEKKETD